MIGFATLEQVDSLRRRAINAGGPTVHADIAGFRVSMEFHPIGEAWSLAITGRGDADVRAALVKRAGVPNIARPEDIHDGLAWHWPESHARSR